MKVEYPKRHIGLNLFRHIRHFPGQPLTYIQNPKVACTSIELMLWRAYAPDTAPENPHSAKNRPYPLRRSQVKPEEVDELLRSDFFSVVRNPYSRLLSAYLDKIAKRESWKRFKALFGFEHAKYPPGLSEFLDALRNTDPFTVDHHFRPQYINLLHNFVPLDFLGHLENIQHIQDYLSRHGFTLTTEAWHATNASKNIKAMIEPEHARIIREYYANDFTIYGYSRDLNITLPVRNVPLNSNRAKLKALLIRATQAKAA